MAIVIEEEQRNTVGFMTVAVWVIIVGVAGVAVYYLFFKNPELISFTTPEGFKNTEAIARINLDPERVVRSPAFQSLKQYVSVPAPAKIGRKNPFLGF